MKKGFAKRSVTYLIAVGLLFVWSSAFADNDYQNTDKGTALRPFETGAERESEGFSVAQISTSTSTTSGNYDVNKSTSSGNYDVNQSTSTSQGSGQGSTEAAKSDDTGKQTSDRVRNSPRYTVPNFNKRGSYAQGK